VGGRTRNHVAVIAVETDTGIGLAFDDPKRGKPYFVDFTSANWRDRIAKGLPRNHIFRRALGVQKGRTARICDATAGFGQDAMMAYSMGCEVVAIERSELVAKVLMDGLVRASRKGLLVNERFKVVQADAVEWFAELNEAARPDVVYLDPMFDKPKKKSKSPKEMQLLQELLGVPPSLVEEESLFRAAMKAARDRVVVKRPLKARALTPDPSHSFMGKSVRFDVYLKRS
jgi:16S rRNA (guanine1516-N2)-methyltransferase